jgi:hypothetical protein
MGIYRKPKLYYMMCLRLKLIPGHGVVVQSILSKPLPLHEPPWQERFLVDFPTPHVFEQVVRCVVTTIDGTYTIPSVAQIIHVMIST